VTRGEGGGARGKWATTGQCFRRTGWEWRVSESNISKKKMEEGIRHNHVKGEKLR